MEKKSNEEKAIHGKWNIKPYLAVGLVVLVVLLCVVTYYFAVLRYHGLSEFGSMTMTILQPILFGIIIAYLVNPIVKWEEKMILRFVKSQSQTLKMKKIVRTVSIFGALTFVIILIGILLRLVIPEVYSSIQGLIENLPDQYKNTVKWFEKILAENAQWSKVLNKGFEQLSDFTLDWLNNDLLPQTKEILGSLTSGIFAVLRVTMNLVIGFIVAAYVLAEKEHFIGQGKKIVFALFTEQTGNNIIYKSRKCNEIFGGFVIGKIIDSLIIGVLTFILLSIFKMPYTMLVSIIVCVTNVIPFFGPFIGAIPSFFLILLIDPVKALWFLLLIFLIQQLDGNVIGPKILGNSTGLSAFWVMFAILVAGGLFGFAGMLFGVPVFAIIYYLLSEWIRGKLKKKNLPLETENYMDFEELKGTKETTEKK